MAHHARRIAGGRQHRRPHCTRLGRDRHESVRDRRHPARGAQSERDLENVTTPPSQAATTTTGTTTGAYMMKLARSCLLSLFLCAVAMAAMSTPARAQATPQAPAPVSPTTAELKDAAAKAPPATALQKGDPGGTITGTINDVPAADPKTGPTIGDLANLAGQNKIAINFVWTLVCGFLVMFMQAGFAIVETGLTRVKNANHTMMMNFMVYGVGMLAYWLIGFAIQEGGVGAVANLGNSPVLSHEFAVNVFGKPFGLWGSGGFFLMHSGSYDVFVMVLFLFQMVFMDTALTIVTGTAAERWKYAAFIVSSFVMGGFTYPLFANWAWGGGWLAT